MNSAKIRKQTRPSDWIPPPDASHVSAGGLRRYIDARPEFRTKLTMNAQSSPSRCQSVFIRLTRSLFFSTALFASTGGWTNAVTAGPPSSAPPTVQIVTPTNSAVFTTPAEIALVAQAQDPDGFEILHIDDDAPTDLPPVITLSPGSQRKYVGQSAMFHITATGTPPLSYQWHFHTRPIIAASNATLNLFGLQITNNGYYRVIVTNAAGAVTSAVALLEVFDRPTQPGQIDPLFIAMLSHRGYVEALVQPSPDRFYAAGFFHEINGVGCGSLARLWADGHVDTNFVPVPALTVNALALQPDGKLLVNLGFSGVASRVARLYPDGSLDTTFTAYTNVSTSVLALQLDGKVVVAGRYPVRQLVRLDADGCLDSSFAVTVDDDMGDYAIRAVTALPNGQLLIGGGFHRVNGIARDGVARLNNDGTVDLTFNPVANPDAWINCLAVLPDGKILVAGGFGWWDNLPRRAIARLNADGSLDPAFDPGEGIGPGDVEIQAIAVQADGRVLIGGNFWQVNGVPRSSLARLNVDGRLDPTFIDPGLSTSDDTSIRAILLQGDDMALVAGDDPVYAIGLVRIYLGPMVMPPTIVIWGSTEESPPSVLWDQPNMVAIAAGVNHSVALKDDGTVVSWGWLEAPADLTNVIAITCGGWHCLALRRDGSVVAWGDNDYSERDVPAGLTDVVAVAAGASHSLVLKRDGTLTAWGDGWYGKTDVAGLSNIVAIAASGGHNLALKREGTLIAWGENYHGDTDVPPGLTNIVAVAAGWCHSLALKADGTVVGWGHNYDWDGEYYFGQADVPEGLSNVVAIAGGAFHSLALRSDGTVVAWGIDPNSPVPWPFYRRKVTVVPALTNVIAIDAGYEHSLALRGDGSVALTVHPVSRPAYTGMAVTLNAMAVGAAPLIYQWQFNGTNLPGATNASLTLANVQLSDTGGYGVVVSNALGATVSRSAALTVTESPPLIVVQPSNQFTYPGGRVCGDVYRGHRVWPGRLLE
jgi:uncharacterized delta-60 repeat protein